MRQSIGQMYRNVRVKICVEYKIYWRSRQEDEYDQRERKLIKDRRITH